jgi:V/A-type H+-transporting ATPase subunit K|tara:strand:- start:916 stop:1215 length:300 start_codon:yes stop_codon:yes gene_type:complete
MNHKNILIILLVISIFSVTPAFAQEETSGIADVGKFLAAAIAFAAAAIGAGLAVGKAGSAGLAAAAERPEMRTTAIIITALGEAIAIYGIVVAILILGS